MPRNCTGMMSSATEAGTSCEPDTSMIAPESILTWPALGRSVGVPPVCQTPASRLTPEVKACPTPSTDPTAVELSGTQLADLRIGQRVRCEADMYGSRREFEGRITGFTMGTGQTLSLLPAQNATGNFVKIVQRLPVRVELTDYDPGKAPLFVGLSVTPYVYYKEPPTGPHAGEILQPLAALPTGTK